MRKRDLANLILTGYTEGKKSRGEQRINYLTNQIELMAEQEQKQIINGQQLLRPKLEIVENYETI